MSEIQGPENKSLDPRWITLRVSRINLGITLLGSLLVLPLLWLINLPVWIRIALLVALVISLIGDLRLILLKGRDSIGAFYLFDLDIASTPAVPDAQAGKSMAGADLPRLGIRIRFAIAAKHLDSAEREGIVLQRAFVSPWFTALRYRLPGEAAWRRWWPRVIPMWSDSLDSQEFRKVRVALKWK